MTAPPLELAALVEIVAGLPGIRGLWESCIPTTAVRTSLRLVATDLFEAWLLAWPPGSSVEPHDHGGSEGAFVVCRGELTEIRWVGSTRRIDWLGAGDVVSVPAEVVHDVVSAGSEVAFSIHAYSPPLREMRFYDNDAASVIAVEPVVEEPTLLDAAVVGSLLRSVVHA